MKEKIFLKKAAAILAAAGLLILPTACSSLESGQTVEVSKTETDGAVETPEREMDETVEKTKTEGEPEVPVQEPSDADDRPTKAAVCGESSNGLCGYPLAAEQSENIIVYETEAGCLSIMLPNTWDYAIKPEEDEEQKGGPADGDIAFWPVAFPEAVFEIKYWEQFGICGTGVTIEELTLSGGLIGYQYTENIENTLWITITLKQSEDSGMNDVYVILASPELSVWEQIEPEFEEILDSVEIDSQKTVPQRKNKFMLLFAGTSNRIDIVQIYCAKYFLEEEKK